jgi:hypothetical protein
MSQRTLHGTRTFRMKQRSRFPCTRPVALSRQINRQYHSANCFQSETTTFSYEIEQIDQLTE